MDRRPIIPIPSPEEARALGLPPEMMDALERARESDRQMQAMLSKRPKRKMPTLPLKSPEDAHKLSEDERRARRAKHRLKRQKAAERHTGGSRGRQTWIKQAKAKAKAERESAH